MPLMPCAGSSEMTRGRKSRKCFHSSMAEHSPCKRKVVSSSLTESSKSSLDTDRVRRVNLSWFGVGSNERVVTSRETENPVVTSPRGRLQKAM